jgi:carbonic anhydrase
MPKVSRRKFVYSAAIAAGGFVLGFASRGLVPTPTPQPEPTPTTPSDALNQLMQGNQRFVQNALIHPNLSAERRTEVAQGQSPWAVILGCIDSRVPPEVVFDQGLGDMFVARTAGQVIDNAVMGSVEYAVEEGVKLIMVLGHQSCGAIKATIQTIQNNGHPEGEIAALVDAIKPAYAAAESMPGDIVENTIRANVKLEVQTLQSSEVISHALAQGSAEIVGARYDLDSGAVTILT